MLNERFGKERNRSAEQIQRLNDQIFLLQSRAENNDTEDTTRGRAGTPSQAVTLDHTYFAQSLCSSLTSSVPRIAGGSSQKSVKPSVKGVEQSVNGAEGHRVSSCSSDAGSSISTPANPTPNRQTLQDDKRSLMLTHAAGASENTANDSAELPGSINHGETDRLARNTLKQGSSSALISASMDRDGHIHSYSGLSYHGMHSSNRGAIKSPRGDFNTKYPESPNGGEAPKSPNDTNSFTSLGGGSNCAGREGGSAIYGVSSNGVSAVGACTDTKSAKSPKSSNATSATSFHPGSLDTKSPKVTLLPSPIMPSTIPSPHTIKGGETADRGLRTFRGGGGAVSGEGGGGRSAASSGRELLEGGGGETKSTMRALYPIPFPLTAAPATVDATISSPNQYPSPSMLRQPFSVDASQPSGVDDEIKLDAGGRGERATSPPLYHTRLPADSVLDESDLDRAESAGSSPPSLSVTLSHVGSSPFQTARSSIGWGAEAWDEAGGEREGGAEEYSRILKEDTRGAVLMGEESREDGGEEGGEADGGGGRTRRGTDCEAGIVLSAAYPFVIEDMQLDKFSPLPLQVCCSLFSLKRCPMGSLSRECGLLIRGM
jgi:hypothetical protein